jgi:hypothetical protein
MSVKGILNPKPPRIMGKFEKKKKKKKILIVFLLYYDTFKNHGKK